MKIGILSVLWICFVAGCNPHPSIEDSAVKITGKMGIYNELRVMIREDSGERDNFAIGLNHIGEYWKSGGTWSRSSDYQRKIELGQVLAEEGLSRERYRKYAEMFDILGCRRVTYSTKTGSVMICLEASGIAVSGCLTELIHRGNTAIPESENEPGYSVEILPIDLDWYLRRDCT